MDKKRKKRDSRDYGNTMTGGYRTHSDGYGGEYGSWGPDTSQRARNLRKKMFR